ncbi:hypothetical protein ACMFMG_008376 [Clarireedia jacksonii]
MRLLRLTFAYMSKRIYFLSIRRFLTHRCFRDQGVHLPSHFSPLRTFLATSHSSRTMADSESDDDLRRAIALSLEEDSPPIRKLESATIDLTVSDEEGDDDLDAPVATRFKSQRLASASSKDVEKVTKPQEVKPAISVLNSLNRKQMEEDRLARVAQRTSVVERRKRKASTSPPPLENGLRQTKVVRNSEDLNTTGTCDVTVAVRGYTDKEATDRRGTLPSSVIISNTQVASGAASLREENKRNFNTQGDVAGSGIQFPRGTIKKTWAHGYAREDDITIEEVLQSSTLDLAVLSTFQINSDWIQSKLLPSTKVVWVLQAKTEFEKENWQSSAPKSFRFCFPSMQGAINCMHSKLQLLAHPTHLRIVLPSANLTPYDWGENGGVIENVVFLIDIPRSSDGKIASDNTLTPFARELLHFLKAMGLDSTIVESLRKFDFSNTNHLALVHSIGGSHSGADMHRTGYCGLGNAVRELGLDTEKLPEVDIITASIGNLNDQFIRSIYLAVQGGDGSKEYKWRTERSPKSKADTLAERTLTDEIGRRLRIHFPSEQTVIESKGGKRVRYFYQTLVQLVT